MKYLAIPLLAGAVFCCTQAPAQKLEFKEHISKQFTLTQNASANTLAIYNVNGFIKVEGYNGDKVLLEIDKTISAKTQEILETGKQEFKIDFEQTADSITAYITNPFDSRPDRNNKNWNGPKIHYHYELNFTVKVPYSLNLHVSTVNGGDVTVNDVTGSLGVYNVNGAIKLVNAKGAANVRTVNGNVDANYLTLPPGESDFKTLNGDIKISYPAALSVDCQFKTFNGNFYTDFTEVESLPVKVIKNEEKKDNKTVYKLSTDTRIRIGKGGAVYKFETFNGNIYLKKQS
ncbi:DUF4097 family beta strand repeat-containing protein [Dyadobacter arcticus]|uniref:DUF4097 and DUF4098 domain-containing protein YvlB n=1 Tax=Dyadobacter arcticus TaxID=1078754 RepID=A0ABX0UM66_9BACT|nr:DUF4097 family beta strand repeat-containing protein [Dyadobacter arcticus]NIJ54056.1 DUF4097 and DUF4098 domain-containing protein YvlB [Dyadobacter arcticus]